MLSVLELLILNQIEEEQKEKENPQTTEIEDIVLSGSENGYILTN